METSARPDTVPRMLEVADRPALISTKEAVRAARLPRRDATPELTGRVEAVRLPS